VVDKVIRLSGAEFDYFSHNLLRDQDFIRDNPIDGRIVDDEGRYHCLLVVGEGRSDGILVNSEGYDYACYSAFIPNAQSWLLAQRYPALAEYNEMLIRVVDYILDEQNEVKAGTDYAIDYADIKKRIGLDISSELRKGESMIDALLTALEDNPKIESVWLYEDSLQIKTAPSELEQYSAARAAAISAGERHKLIAWRGVVEESRFQWREDDRYRLCDDGALFYLGDKSGQYMRIGKMGEFSVGTYESANPGTVGAVLTCRFWEQLDSYEQALIKASVLAGPRFFDDICTGAADLAAAIEKEVTAKQGSEKPSVLEQLHEAKKNPVPHKPKEEKGGREVSL
jgi:hypothetical protein